jgi:hypothetical protein
MRDPDQRGHIHTSWRDDDESNEAYSDFGPELEQLFDRTRTVFELARFDAAFLWANVIVRARERLQALHFAKIPSHRMLAIRRGESEGLLMMRIQPPEEEALGLIEPIFVTGRGPAAEQVRLAVQDSYKRLLGQAIEVEMRIESKKRADVEAIRVFSETTGLQAHPHLVPSRSSPESVSDLGRQPRARPKNYLLPGGFCSHPLPHES